MFSTYHLDINFEVEKILLISHFLSVAYFYGKVYTMLAISWVESFQKPIITIMNFSISWEVL